LKRRPHFVNTCKWHLKPIKISSKELIADGLFQAKIDKKAI
jgi:hypothetical protein